ncbi:MAG: glycosyltransferase family 2 protein [Clostridiales bacterium]|jgi:glycosyltransferase involved in cell wall biosynthesis|nr:glycosyltransferase family 2 protein [Clostridiales bacterium]
MRFSACWIVKNEEENLKKSIMSVKGCAEELIVVDTGSTDGTVRVAEECGARVAHFTWIGDFSAARNYALSLTKGELVIFLDADEYFQPGLTKADGAVFSALFEDARLCGLGFSTREMDKATGVCRDISLRLRVLRRGVVRFEGMIHETPARTDGTEPEWKLMEHYVLVHTGYSDAVLMQKFRRNIEILEAERETLTDPLKLYFNAMYLLRDSFNFDDYDKAARYLTYTLSHHELHKAVYSASASGYLRYFYTAVHAAEARRDHFSRKEIYHKLFGSLKELYAGGWDALPAEIHYQLRFDYRDDRFLREVEEVAPSLLKALTVEVPDRRLIEARIFEQAAEACHMRGDRMKTCLYAYRALECMPAIEGRPLLLLLHSLKDHPLSDAKRILKSAALPGRPDVAGQVIALLDAKGERERLFRSAEPLGLFPPENSFAGIMGARETAESRTALFRLKAEKLFARMRYGDILSEPDAVFAAERHYVCAYYVAYALLMQGEYEKACDIVTRHISNGAANQALLSILLVTAEKMPEPKAAEARRRYEAVMGIVSEVVDLQDVINTGTVYGADPQKEKRLMAEMPFSDFLAAYERDKSKPVTDFLLKSHERAVTVFERNGCVLTAAESYRLLLAKWHDREGSIRHLIRLFGESGNHEAAARIKGWML